jgi:hypothetical protein
MSEQETPQPDKILAQDQEILVKMQQLAQSLQTSNLLDEKTQQNLERLKEEGRGY